MTCHKANRLEFSGDKLLGEQPVSAQPRMCPQSLAALNDDLEAQS